ncbi:phage portal protein [Saccharothrix variisporea]|uniref:Phage portal protein n=1 Tax=Saccharothrix variisporea TaxID=543527 RepID=A0A495X1N0_9PSEU|nr:phage portal protein [Saccharothrix variisporea]RKT67104.1 phage portal protein [Saccharothrix variisporea]
MPNLWSTLRGKREQRYTIDDWAQDNLTYNGLTYPLFGMPSPTNVEDIENSFLGYVQGAYKSNGVVFAAMEARRLVFSSARFMWQRMRDGQPGELFSTPELELLRKPWPNGTSFELLSRMEQDVSLAGNFYAVRESPRRLRRLRPDCVSIILSAPPDEAVASDVVGYQFKPGGPSSRAEPEFYSVEEVVHWSPTPDPAAQYRGMSWLTPVVREVMGDKLATEHKLKFFENAATPSLAVSFKETVTKTQFDQFVAAMKEAHAGAHNAYKPLFLGGGADVTVIGADLQQLDFKSTQGAGETRIATASRVPAVVLGISEGMQGSSLNAGNFKAAKRNFQDGFLHPQWESACAALGMITRSPGSDVRLWYDARSIPFLRDDQTDEAEIQVKQATALRSLLDAGYKPDAAVAYIETSDIRRLIGQHSGLFSVQLQKPGSTGAPNEAPADDDKDE